MEAISATYDEEYALTANTFTRTGYKFTGWNTEADGSGTSYEDGATVSNLTTTDGDTVTLYAQWEPITYTIAFDSNGADDGEMESIEATYDEEYTLTANTFTKAGYKFTGWNTEADGSGTSYEDEAVVSNLTTEEEATVTLYAQWKEYTITVTEYTGDTIEAEYDYEEGTTIIYIIDAASLELEETYVWYYDITRTNTDIGLFFNEEAEDTLPLYNEVAAYFTSDFGYYDIYYTGSFLTTDATELYLGGDFSRLGTDYSAMQFR